MEARVQAGTASPEETVRLGEQYLDRGNFLKAGEMGLRARKANPRLAGAHTLLALVYLEARQPEAARQAFRQALAAAPQDLTLRLNLARFELDQGRPEEALPVLEPAQKQAPENAQVWLLTARAQGLRNELLVAAKTLRRTLSLDPNLAEAHVMLGRLEMDFDHYQPAREHFEAGYRNGDHSPITLSYYALSLLMDRGTDADAQQAEQFLRDAGNPSIPPARFARALLMERRKEYPAAAAELRAILAEEPRNERAQFALARVLRATHDPGARAALARYHQLIREREQVVALSYRLSQQGPSPDLLRSLGQLLLNAGQPEQAAVQFRAWARLAPRDPEPKKWLARAESAARKRS